MMDSPSIRSREMKLWVVADQQQGHSALRQHAQGQYPTAAQAIDEMTCRQGQQQGRDELEETHQTKIPGATRELVHLPGDSHHQHLLGQHGR